MQMKLLLLLIFPCLCLGAIFEDDSRFEARLEGSHEIMDLSKSVPAIFRNTSLKKRGDGDYDSVNWSSDNLGFCADTKFAGQPHLANCSASLIAPDIILTAAHCVDDAKKGCGDFKIVFDYAMGEDLKIIKKDLVYECKKVLYHNFDPTMQADDIAIVQIDRKVTDRRPVKISKAYLELNEELTMIGYPLGLPQKADEQGRTSTIDRTNKSFKHNIDTFSCNSGGPIFNKKGEQVGVLVRGTGSNQTQREGENCMDWTEAKEQDYAEANSLVHLKKILKSLGIKQQ